VVSLTIVITDGGLDETAAGAAVRELYQRLLAAWNQRCAADFAALFAADGLLVGFDGSQARGDQVAGHLGPIFADHPTAKYVAKVRWLRSLGADAVMLVATVGMAPPGGTLLNPSANALQTVVAERSADGWQIVLFQNTPAQYHGHPETAAQHTAELQPLVTAGVVLA
jgi:uncharacterized protein (TIGR02246 family)